MTPVAITLSSKAAETLVASRVSGVIATPVSAELGRFLSRIHVPLIEVDRGFYATGADAVVVDNRSAAPDRREADAPSPRGVIVADHRHTGFDGSPPHPGVSTT